MRFMLFVYSGRGHQRRAAARAGRGDEPLQRGARRARACSSPLDGLHPPPAHARLTFASGGRPTVTDGPFTEAKELVGGYWIIQARSKEEAVEWASRAPLGDGTIEVRRIAEGADYCPEIEAAAGCPQTPPEQTVAE